jgi:hypothetical protein
VFTNKLLIKYLLQILLSLLNGLKICILVDHLIGFFVAFQAPDKNDQTALDGIADTLFLVRFLSGKDMQGDNAIEQAPYRVAAAANIDLRRDFALLDAFLQNVLDHLNRIVRHFNDVLIDIVRQIHIFGMEHKGHHYSEQFPVIEKKFDIDAGEFNNKFRDRFTLCKKVSRFFVEFIDVVEEDLGVYFFFAVEVEIDGTFAEFRFFCDVFDGDIPEAFFEKQFPSSAEDSASSLLLLSFPSFLKSHDGNVFLAGKISVTAVHILNLSQLLTDGQYLDILPSRVCQGKI